MSTLWCLSHQKWQRLSTCLKFNSDCRLTTVYLSMTSNMLQTLVGYLSDFLITKLQTWFYKVRNYSKTSYCLFIHEKTLSKCSYLSKISYLLKYRTNLPLTHHFTHWKSHQNRCITEMFGLAMDCKRSWSLCLVTNLKSQSVEQHLLELLYLCIGYGSGNHWWGCDCSESFG